jgi:4-amino-4-deoxy-L-arabinose transferase-like glycosyltransferase
MSGQVLESESIFQERSWLRDVGVLIPLLVLYFSLAFYRLDHQSLWVDEVLSLTADELEQPLLARDRWLAGRGPLYPIILQLWMRWGTSEFALRSLSVLLGGIAVCLTYLLSLRFCTRQVALFSALLLATSPLLIWYSQEVRYVMLMISTALLATYTFHLALRAKRYGWWLLYGSSLLVAIAAFVVNIFLPVAHGLYLISSRLHRPLLRQWLVSLLPVLMVSMWWANDGRLWQLDGHFRNLSKHITISVPNLLAWEPTDRLPTVRRRAFELMALPYTFFTFSAGFSLGPSVPELHRSRSLAALAPHALMLFTCILLFGSLVLRGIMALRHRPDAGLFLGWWLAVPIIGALGLSSLVSSLTYNVRYVAMGLPAYIMILAGGIASARSHPMQMLLLAAVLLINGFSLANYYGDPRYSREDARAAARYLEGAAQPRDIILVVGNTTALQYYYKGSRPLVRWKHSVISDPSALVEHVQGLSEDHEHLWLVSIRPWQVDPDGRVKALVDTLYSRLHRQEFPSISIYTYQLRPTTAEMHPFSRGRGSR